MSRKDNGLTRKRRVLVVYGGRSSEHDVSLQSAASVINNLDRDQYEIVPVAIDKAGGWHLNDARQFQTPQKALPVYPEAPRVAITPSPADRALAEASGGAIDVVFPVMHGPLCEDGCIQGLLELADLPYVGSGVLGSAISMDKEVTKRLVVAAGIDTAAFFSFKAAEWRGDARSITRHLLQEIGLPLFTKPVNLGSSVGIHKVKKEEDLAPAIEDSLLYDRKVLVERALDVREIELSVLEQIDETQPPLVSLPGEVIPRHEFYSYQAKYLDENGARFEIPAKLSEIQVQEAQRMARDVFRIAECEAMARVDLFLEKQTGRLLFNEINTIPGFTTISMYPKMFEASGMSYRELLSRLIELAIVRHKRRRDLKRDY
ncbi:MAG: D-alanine--D-alanine ligase [Deltaproteobacteria bacterium]|nr:D-alanine--D-alanine ligase [Deltaproteobacteria bacterium]